MELTIAGPNLSSGATFHVHKAGCRDLKRGALYRGATMYHEEHDCLQSLVEDTYADQIAEADGSNEWSSYAQEFDIFPCVGELPDLAPSPQATQEVSETSLQSDPVSDTVVPSKAVRNTKPKSQSQSNKEQGKMSTKTATKSKTENKTWNGRQARSVVARRNKGMSWAAIGAEFGVSPRTARAMFDHIKGDGAHYDDRLVGKGGRTREIFPIAETLARLAKEASVEA